jgi:hypothetical protein
MLRGDNGFIFCQHCVDEGFVDDFAVQQPGSWGADGAALLLAVAEQFRVTDYAAVLHIVTAHADQPTVRSRCNIIVTGGGDAGKTLQMAALAT